MELETLVNVREYLIKAGIISQNDNPLIECLTGGVSSSIWKISLKENRWVIKQALPQLRVDAVWISDVERIHREHEVMTDLWSIVPEGSIPKVIYVDYINHIYMMTCAEEKVFTLKEMLMNGDYSLVIMENLAFLLKCIHDQSFRLKKDLEEKYSDQKYFIQLRIDPFHRYLIHKYPELKLSIQKLIDDLTLHKKCLVHGDFSPKNILVNKNSNLVIIDFEVAHWGNPIFDVAFCIGHLLLKGWYLKRHKEILEMIKVFLSSYGGEVSNLIPHLGLILLARMDGKSPVNYIKDDHMINAIRKVAISWIKQDKQDIDVFKTIQSDFITGSICH